MKAKIVALTAAAAVVLVCSDVIRAHNVFPEPCIKSTLCNGLLERYDLAQPTDTQRWGAFMSRLFEPPAQNVSQRTVASVTGADFTANASIYLWNSNSSGLTGPHTIAVWIYPDSLPADGVYQTLLSWTHSNAAGPDFHLTSSAGVKYAGYTIWDQTGQAAANVSISGVTSGSWQLVVVGLRPALDGDGNPIGLRLFGSRNGAALSEGGSVGFRPHPGFFQIRIGQRPYNGAVSNGDQSGFDGAIAHLAFWSRDLSNSEISLLWNSGTPRAYPYVSE